MIAIDRFEGGGATALNGGVIYLGGGTSVQKAAGYDDTPEAMYEYLSQEVEDIISEETLRRFCESGPETIVAEELAGRAQGFGDPVAEEHDRPVGGEPGTRGVEGEAGDRADHDSARHGQ